MPEKPKRSLSLLVCQAMVAVAARLIPSAQREDWRREWQAEVWHRWQFLAHAGAWNTYEALLLLRRCAGAYVDAFWQFTERRFVFTRFYSDPKISGAVRSPWFCLGILGFALFLLTALTSGFPATRNLLRTGMDPAASRLVFIFFHPSVGGAGEGLPPDVVPAWAMRSRLLDGLAPFVIGHRIIRNAEGNSMLPLVIKTQTNLFGVLGVKPVLGVFPSRQGVVLTHAVWETLFDSDSHVIGTKIRIGQEWLPVSAVLSPTFRFLSRQPTAFLVESVLQDAQVMLIGRLKPGISQRSLDKELTRIAETACYYFFGSDLRYSFLSAAAWTPVKVFGCAALASIILVTAVSGFRIRRLRILLSAHGRRSLLFRTSFFSAKVLLGFLVVFLAALEWSRSQSAILYGSRDPASGPFLLWLYILGTMGVLFWALVDQRARCRVCLRLLSFPVRVGCPGCLLLDWSGTELLCSEGHGLLHVPHMAPSWDEESERWISLDESWKDLFAETK